MNDPKNDRPPLAVRETSRRLLGYFQPRDPPSERIGAEEEEIDVITEALMPMVELLDRPSYTPPAAPAPGASLADIIAGYEARQLVLAVELPALRAEYQRLATALTSAEAEDATIRETLGPLHEKLRPGKQLVLPGQEPSASPAATRQPEQAHPMPADWTLEPYRIRALAADLKLPEDQVKDALPLYRADMIKGGAQMARWGAGFRAALARGEYLPKVSSPRLELPSSSELSDMIFQAIALGADTWDKLERMLAGQNAALTSDVIRQRLHQLAQGGHEKAGAILAAWPTIPRPVPDDHREEEQLAAEAQAEQTGGGG